MQRPNLAVVLVAVVAGTEFYLCAAQEIRGVTLHGNIAETAATHRWCPFNQLEEVVFDTLDFMHLYAHAYACTDSVALVLCDVVVFERQTSGEYRLFHCPHSR